MVRKTLRTFPTLLVALTLVSAVFLSFNGPSVSAAGPDLRLRPNDGAPGIAVQARGRDFSPGTTGAIYWESDTLVLADFTADEDGDFEVPIAIPDVPSGVYTVIARSEDGEDASDEFEVEAGDDNAPVTSSSPASSPPPIPSPAALASEDCPSDATRVVDVADSVQLTAALADAQPGDLIRLASGSYPGTYVAESDGAADERIWLCGDRDAVIDAGDSGNGYALHITGDYWTVHGITITNALKGVMLDDAQFTVLERLDVHTIGHEAIHLRTNSSDNVVQDNDIHDTGLKRDKFGEGVYVGSAVSNWEKYANGGPDRSDRNQVLRNRIWNTTSESIDIKEGTTGGLIEDNVFDGSALAGADSWVDVKGNSYVIRNNTGTNSPTDGFQTHVIDDMDWGRDNLFENNFAEVNGSGFGFYIHDAETSNNTVSCTNEVTAAESGFANVACT